MKRFYTLVCLLLALASAQPALADNPQIDSMRVALDNVFAQLNKTQIPAPYLQEYGYQFASLTPFNGTLTDSSKTTIGLW